MITRYKSPYRVMWRLDGSRFRKKQNRTERLVLNIRLYTVEPPIKDTRNKEHLSIKDKSTHPGSYYQYILTSE